MSGGDKKIKDAFRLILKGKDENQIQDGCDIINEVLFSNDNLNILKRYLFFLDNIESLKSKKIEQIDPTINIDLLDIIELNNLLKSISN